MYSLTFDESDSMWRSLTFPISPSAYPCNVGDIRLVNGYTIYEGRVEVCLDGSWGTICDETITGKERLVCRQLFGEEIGNEWQHNCTH